MKASRRSMFRSAAIAAGTVTALALPMGAAFADTPDAPGAGTSTPAVQPANPDEPGTLPEIDPGTKADEDLDQHKPQDKSEDQVADDTIRPQDDSPTEQDVKHDYQVRTVKLKDGGKAVVSKAKNGVFGVQLFDKNGNAGAALQAGGTTMLKSGLKVTLTKSGQITQAWTKSAKPKRGHDDAKQWSVSLKDGNTAVVRKGTDGVYGAKIWDRNGIAVDGVHAKTKPSVTLPSGLKVTLTKYGKLIEQWASQQVKPGASHDTEPRGAATNATPGSDVKAGSETVESDYATPLLAHSGAAAAADASDLGFTMLSHT